MSIATATLVGMASLPAAFARAQYVTKPEYRALFAELERTDVVVEGATKPKSVLYVFFDADCYNCNPTWKALQPYEKVGLQVRCSMQTRHARPAGTPCDHRTAGTVDSRS